MVPELRVLDMSMTKLLSKASNVKTAATKGQSRLLVSRTWLQRTVLRRADTPRDTTSWTHEIRSRESAEGMWSGADLR
jgi:hypothetical protein